GHSSRERPGPRRQIPPRKSGPLPEQDSLDGLPALTAGTPAPAGFDGPRLRVQARALAAKRADVVAKVAPELVTLLGDGFREAFLAYAKCRPMFGGYRQDALDFARSLLDAGRPGDADTRRALARWWKERAGARPPGRAARLLNTVSGATLGRRNRSTYRVSKGVEPHSSLT
ncbi:hypothetical protein ABZ726_19065, partial [Streptomyces hundungensis]